MKLSYRPALDGVRALAIAPVVTMHAFGLPQEGSLGVDLFFVLSGFLITTLLLGEQLATGAISFRSFYRRRAARLFPALFVMLAIFVVATRGAHLLPVLFAATYTTNLASVADPAAIPWSLGHMWSLAQEEQFYLWWPPLLFLLIRKRPEQLTRIIGALILAVVFEKVIMLAAGVGQPRIYFGPDTHADSLLIGCLFGVLFASGRAPAVGKLGPLVVAVLIAAVGASEWSPLLKAISPVRTLFAFGCGFLILAAVEKRLVARLLATRPLAFLGQISYSLYLWHVPILAAAGGAAYNHDPARSALAAAAAVAVATASFFLVERPLRQRWRQSRSTGVLTAAGQPMTSSSTSSGVRPSAALRSSLHAATRMPSAS